ncbi:PilM protein [Collimonas sp. PA-H2]|uniref:type IV pilus biogenesis protein PilM n=1 Tax=Collimonas sp. PA-H2 TaxID=1881062 RepID=UPI000BF9B736|nr:type IV pilus biogenesis protein PilM [Collimonas sp. PA-H2]PFH10287.1 PilM protein [Collimonas sp. PA-H2]
MWMTWILVAMMSLTGYFFLEDQLKSPQPPIQKTLDLAASMATYRQTVIAYLSRNPAFAGDAVPEAALSSYLPSWYVSYPSWKNYLSADGTIVIYAPNLPPLDIVPDIARLSQNSLLAGVADLKSGTLHTPAAGDTGIPLPAGVALPDGGPVWLARRNQ